MKLHLTLGLTVLLLAGCAGEPQAESPATVAPTTALTTTAPSTAAPTTTAPTTTAPTTAAPTVEPSAEPTMDEAGVASALAEAFTPPTEAPDVDPAADPETQYLEAFKAELVALPDGPYLQVGSDIDAVNLGYEACGALSFMDHADALLEYSFSEEGTEETVPNYNAALNVVPFTLCPPTG
jgi:hypothetical protein